MLSIVKNLLVSMRKSKLPWSYLYKRIQAIPVSWSEWVAKHIVNEYASVHHSGFSRQRPWTPGIGHLQEDSALNRYKGQLPFSFHQTRECSKLRSRRTFHKKQSFVWREALSTLRNKAFRQIIHRSHNINIVGRILQVWILVLSANDSECSKPSLL